MGALLRRIVLGDRRLDGVDTLSKPGIHHLPVKEDSSDVEIVK